MVYRIWTAVMDLSPPRCTAYMESLIRETSRKKIVRDKTRANEQNDSGEIILVKQSTLNRPTNEFYEDC